MPRVQSFAPVAGKAPRILILGSMPGEASLAAGQYYAHPRNAFWRAMADVLGFDGGAPYEDRLEALKASGIALWDVLHSCHRQGSLDARIERDTLVANDFASFLAAHPGIGRVLFNGAKADECFGREVLVHGIGAGLLRQRLPSTSPANASWSYERKLGAWRGALLEGAAACL